MRPELVRRQRNERERGAAVASAFKPEGVYPRLAYSADSLESPDGRQDPLRSDRRHVCSESCNERYHAARATEEADKAFDMVDGAERRIHESLAAMHAKAASKLARQA